MGKQISIRLRDEDEELARRLAAYSKRGAQGDLVRFALYCVLMPDSDLPASVAAAAEHFELASRDPIEQSTMMQMVVDNQSDIAAALNKLAERPAQTQAPPAQREVHSAGVDMTRERPRKANHPKAEPGTEPVH